MNQDLGRKEYKIGKISELMGMTTEALRYYEREGIISPRKAEASGYRLYSAWDVHMLIRARTYRRYGFSLAEAVEAFDFENSSDITKRMSEKEDELAQTIKEEERLLQQIKTDRFRIEDAIANLGKFRIEYCPAMHVIETQKSYDILESRVSLYRKWIDLVPYSTSGGLFESFEGNRLRYGLIVDDKNVSFLDQSIMEGTIPIPRQKCISTFFRSGSDQELCMDNFAPTLAFIEEKGLKQTGDSFARAVIMTRSKDGIYHSIYQGWTPFEGDCEYCCSPPIDD